MNKFSNVIINWYEEHGRDLPWRNVSDPYLIWISEIILQQTRVNQGYAYYQRFISRFPDVCALAQASEEEVLKYWEGLGYYSRARNLHQAARDMNGVFPTDYQGVLALKGVGTYTAAAICSFAFNQPYAVVDGNVYRVLSRYFALDVPIDTSAGKHLFSDLSQQLLDEARPALYNQAIMDFGAIQCVPQSPACEVCPLIDSCKAYASALVDSLPVKSHKIKVSRRFFTYIYIRCGTSLFIQRRRASDIWKGLYQLPLIESSHPLSLEELILTSEWQSWLSACNSPQVRCVAKGVRHVLSHQVILADFYEVEIDSASSLPNDWLKILREDIGNYAMPRLITGFFEKYI